MKTTTITQGTMLPGTPQDVYELLMDERKHAAFTNGEAAISRAVGGAFVTFDGWATGTNVELVPNRKIVQTWRGDDWPKGHYSTITIQLLPAKRGTKLLFTQTDVPLNVAKDVTRGWRDFYWTPMKEFLSS